MCENGLHVGRYELPVVLQLRGHARTPRELLRVPRERPGPGGGRADPA